MYIGMTNLVEQTLFGQAYRDFADSLKSTATKHACAYSLQKYMRHLQVQTVDELLKNIDKPKLIEAEIIE
jgi:hypothetical protein